MLKILAAATIALLQFSPARATVVQFNFFSTPARAVSPEALMFAPGFLGQRMTAQIVLDVPSIRNLSYTAQFSRGTYFAQSAPYLISAAGDFASYDDPFNLFGGISIQTNARGKLTSIYFSYAQDTPDVYYTLNSSGWGDASTTWYQTRGRWAVTGPAAVPLPASGALLLVAAGVLGTLRRRANVLRRDAS